MADNEGDCVREYRKFFTDFAATVNPEDQLPVKVAGYNLRESEIVGEIVDWILQYLNQKRCPSSLIAPLTRTVLDEMKLACKRQPTACGFREEEGVFQPLRLMQAVMAQLIQVCLRLCDNGLLPSLSPCPGPLVSACAIKNTRRRMEDRHVVVPDLHTVFGVPDRSPASYYAVFDGHAGTDAAVYAVCHLHQFLVESVHYPQDPVQALRDAFLRTDAMFLDKSHIENLRSGTTALCALLRPQERMLYVAWLGDSQALLVSRGRPIQVVNPHKPDRQDEKDRIESMGGCVLFWGTWRVNGQLAVSRAIGDLEYKPYVTGEPDVKAIPLTGEEDFLVLACDGLWDFVSEQEVVLAVYQKLRESPDDLDAVSEVLVQLSKSQGSTDNVSVIVVFLAPPAALRAMAEHPPLLLDLPAFRQNGASFLDDLGPETDVDGEPLSPGKDAARRDAPTPPVDGGPCKPHVAAESDNVADSGEESEDEWNYFRVEPSGAEQKQVDPKACEKPDITLELSNMESQLNPDAAEFVPSPTREDRVLAQSPVKNGRPMDDVVVPSQAEFLEEVRQRPGEDGVMATDAELAQILNESDTCSTHAEFGDESTMSFAGSELGKGLKPGNSENLSTYSGLDNSFTEKELENEPATPNLSESETSARIENDFSNFRDELDLNEAELPLDVRHVSFELQKELVPQMEPEPERVQLDSEETSSSRDLEPTSPHNPDDDILLEFESHVEQVADDVGIVSDITCIESDSTSIKELEIANLGFGAGKNNFENIVNGSISNLQPDVSSVLESKSPIKDSADLTDKVPSCFSPVRSLTSPNSEPKSPLLSEHSSLPEAQSPLPEIQSFFPVTHSPLPDIRAAQLEAHSPVMESHSPVMDATSLITDMQSALLDPQSLEPVGNFNILDTPAQKNNSPLPEKHSSLLETEPSFPEMQSATLQSQSLQIENQLQTSESQFLTQEIQTAAFEGSVLSETHALANAMQYNPFTTPAIQPEAVLPVSGSKSPSLEVHSSPCPSPLPDIHSPLPDVESGVQELQKHSPLPNETETIGPGHPLYMCVYPLRNQEDEMELKNHDLYQQSDNSIERKELELETAVDLGNTEPAPMPVLKDIFGDVAPASMEVSGDMLCGMESSPVEVYKQPNLVETDELWRCKYPLESREPIEPCEKETDAMSLLSAHDKIETEVAEIVQEVNGHERCSVQTPPPTPAVPVDLEPSELAAVAEKLAEVSVNEDTQIKPDDGGQAVTAAATVAATVATAVAAGAVMADKDKSLEKKEALKKTTITKRSVTDKPKPSGHKTAAASAKATVGGKTPTSPTKPATVSATPRSTSTPKKPASAPIGIARTKPVAAAAPSSTTPVKSKSLSSSPTKPVATAPAKTIPKTRPVSAVSKSAEKKTVPLTNGDTTSKPVTKRAEPVTTRKITSTLTNRSPAAKPLAAAPASNKTASGLSKQASTASSRTTSATTRPKTAPVNGVASKTKSAPTATTLTSRTKAPSAGIQAKQVKESTNKQISSSRVNTVPKTASTGTATRTASTTTVRRVAGNVTKSSTTTVTKSGAKRTTTTAVSKIRTDKAKVTNNNEQVSTEVITTEMKMEPTQPAITN